MKRLLIISVILNLIFGLYVIKKIIGRYEIQKQEKKKELITYNQPEPVTYELGLNEVFKFLPNDSNEIIFAGNSFTENFPLDELFKNPRIKNRGINGDITKGLLLRLNEIIESKPKKIFLEIGTNDILRNYAFDSVKMNYYEIIHKVKQETPSTKIYVQSLFPTSLNVWGTKRPAIENIKAFNKYLKNLSEKEEVEYIDLYSYFVEGDSLNPKYDSGDKIHLNGKGYLLWTEKIKKYIVAPQQ
ncbi:MAG: GDSL-type esterase/lipase family protein [Bacteroidia bacterium]